MLSQRPSLIRPPAVYIRSFHLKWTPKKEKESEGQKQQEEGAEQKERGEYSSSSSVCNKRWPREWFSTIGRQYNKALGHWFPAKASAAAIQ